MVGLLPKQKEELNKAIYDYLLRNKYNNSAESFVKEAGIVANGIESSGSSNKLNSLENKWTTVVKLKK
jgi:hypothetical protein